MAEGQIQFNLDRERFQTALTQLSSSNSFNLQHEFKTKGISLSQSLLTWQGELGNTWLLADFENKKTYDIEMVGDTAENRRVEVSEQSTDTEQPFTLTNAETILLQLQSVYRGTDQGFIDFLKRINLDELDLERLERPDLSGAGFSFEPVYQDLLVVHSMLRETLTSSHEWMLHFPRGIARDVVNQQLQQFYENVRQIEDFEISDDNPKQTHDNLLEGISSFCDIAKESLRDIVGYLSSGKVSQRRAEVDDLVAKLKAENKRAEEITNETEKKLAEKEEEVNQLILKMQNQLTEKPISQYKAIFADQAKEHHKGAWSWLKMAGGATAAFFLAFAGLTIWLGSEGSGLTGTLQNLFTKGFVLSPIYVWLNRSIKNYTAQKHLEVINTHRQNALETFDTFVAAAEGNRETRDAVLLSATDAIFDANQTGYLSTKGSGSDSRSPVQQIIREFIPDRSASKSS